MLFPVRSIVALYRSCGIVDNCCSVKTQSCFFSLHWAVTVVRQTTWSLTTAAFSNEGMTTVLFSSYIAAQLCVDCVALGKSYHLSLMQQICVFNIMFPFFLCWDIHFSSVGKMTCTVVFSLAEWHPHLTRNSCPPPQYFRYAHISYTKRHIYVLYIQTHEQIQKRAQGRCAVHYGIS